MQRKQYDMQLAQEKSTSIIIDRNILDDEWPRSGTKGSSTKAEDAANEETN